MLKALIQKYIIPAIVAAVFGGGSWFLKGCENDKEVRELTNQLTKETNAKIATSDSLRLERKNVNILADSVTVMNATLQIQTEQIKGLQTNALVLRNANTAKNARIEECEDNMKKAIETGIILADTLFIRDIPLSKWWEEVDRPKFLKLKPKQ